MNYIRFMHKRTCTRFRGFTLVEILAAIGIITTLTSISIVGTSEVRQKSRDAERVSDLNQIAVALRIYKSENGSHPGVVPNFFDGFNPPWYEFNADNGVPVGEGIPSATLGSLAGANGLFTSLVGDYMGGEVPADPRAGDAGYQYYYHSSHVCDVGGVSHYVVALYAETTEKGSTGNWNSVCPGDPSSITSPSTYGLILEVRQPTGS